MWDFAAYLGGCYFKQPSCNLMVLSRIDSLDKEESILVEGLPSTSLILDDIHWHIHIDLITNSVYVVPQRSWGDRGDTDHSKCLLLGGRRLNLLTIIPKPKGSGGARAATAQIGPANERNKTK